MFRSEGDEKIEKIEKRNLRSSEVCYLVDEISFFVRFRFNLLVIDFFFLLVFRGFLVVRFDDLRGK